MPKSAKRRLLLKSEVFKKQRPTEYSNMCSRINRLVNGLKKQVNG